MTAPDFRLNHQTTTALGRQHAVLCGRGTTALWLALQVIRRRRASLGSAGPGDVILPDILCATVLDGILLAGFRPVFAGVTPDRFTLDPGAVARLVTPDTRAIIAAHVFGHIVDVDAIRQAAPGIPVIEDAVQGLGGHFQGRPAGSLGDLSFISFDDAKMIGGRGGVLLFDDSLDDSLDGFFDASLHGGLDAELNLDFLRTLLPPAAAAAYAAQLRAVAPSLLCPMNLAAANVESILDGWRTLSARVAARNDKARWLHGRLSGLPLTLPAIREGDAIWRYSFAVPTAVGARRVMRKLQLAGLNGSGLYYPLSRFWESRGQQAGAGALANRFVNLWVDEATHQADLVRAADVVAEVMTAIPPGRIAGRIVD